MSVRVEGKQFWVKGRPGLVLGGEYQYFRIDPELWEPGIRTLQENGVTLLSSYIPWIWHEAEEGVLDLEGKREPATNLVRFLDLCRALEMPLILKPGPYIYAEYQGFGIPHWVRELHPHLKMAIKDPGYPEIALNHPDFLTLVERWFSALWPLLSRYEHLVGIQVDNETGMPQYGQGPFLFDKNPDTVRQFREFLARKYVSIDPLNQICGTRFHSFEGIDERLYDPPSPPVLAELAVFAEDYVAHYLAALRGIWEKLGYRGFFFTNDLAMPTWPNHLRKKSRVVPVAFDLYPKFIPVRTDLDQPFSISYVPKLFGTLNEGPLFCAEMGCGWLDERVKVPAIATLQKTLASFLHGSQGTILYPIQDGIDPDREAFLFQAALDFEGKPRERMQVVRALGRFCREWGEDLASSEPLESPVGILHHPRAIHDLLPYALDPVEAAKTRLDEVLDRSVILYSANMGLYGTLAESGFTPRVLDLEAATEEELSACRVLFLNSTGSLESALSRKLQGFVEGGGNLVVLGIPFEDPVLLPRIRRAWRPQSLAAVVSTVGDLLSFNLWDREKINHPLVRFTIEKLQPVIGLLKHATRAGVWTKSHLTGERVWSSRFLSYP
ncbi:MAG: beta-galactosidase, partial [Bacteroidota bacterium]